MNTPPHHDTLQPGVSLGSTQTPSTRLPPPSRLKDSKKVCFYKSGDTQFSGQWIVINSRTFKTFDALLDVLSKKVPLPFGVRTITTPKGRHTIQSLVDLQNGASYVCSDQKRVKPLNLNEVNKTHVPWNTTRPTSAGRHRRRGLIRQLLKRNEAGRTAKNVVAMWTPKRLVVFKNRDPSIKHIVSLQRRSTPTFEALLDYLSQVMQFPVVKLYTADGTRVDGLPALVLCSGTVVAAGNEPFRLGHFNLQASTQPSRSAVTELSRPAKTQQLPQVKDKSVSSRPGSRNFSLSSERYFVSQVNESLNRSHSEDNGQKTGSLEAMNSQPLEEMEACAMPKDDEIEKSFRVNQDGSMTVEMKVRLTIKQEEMINWTTTVSRTCVNSQQMTWCSQPVTGYNSPDNNNNKDNRTTEAMTGSYESKEDNTLTDKSFNLNQEGENLYGSDTFEATEKPKLCVRRPPTPGPKCVRRKQTSVENIKRLSQTEVQESKVGTYSYTECTPEGELMEGYCLVSHSSSSSTRPVPKPRTSSLRTGNKHKKAYSSISGTAEVLQLQNNGSGITETVMHIYQSQGTYKNYFANSQVASDGELQEQKKTHSAGSGSCSLSNDCDIDLRKQSASNDSQNATKNELLSLSSTQSSTWVENLLPSTREKYDNKKMLDKQVSSAPNLNFCNSPELQSYTALEKKKFSSGDLKCGQRVQNKKKELSGQKENSPRMRSTQNVNVFQTDTLRPHFKKKTDIMPPSHLPPLKMLTNQRSLNGRTKSHKESRELTESVSMPVIQSSPSSVHQYVENWLENIQPECATCMDEISPYDREYEPRAKFQIGSGSSDTSEIRSELDKESMPQNCASPESNTTERPVSQPPVQIRYDDEPMEAQKLRGFCKSMPCVRIDPAEQETSLKMLKSSDTLVPKEQEGAISRKSGMKHVLQQLCLSVQSIRRASSDSQLTSLEGRKHSSLPDFSTQLASVFGSPSESLLSFLIVMTLKDGMSKTGNESGSYPEALQVMQSIEKIASIEDEEELKASLSSLHSSTSSKLKKSWRDFQEQNDTEDCPPLSPRLSEQEFALEVNSEGEDQEKEQIFGIKELMDELNMDVNLRKEISFLAGEDLTHSGENHANETANTAHDDMEAPVKGDVGGFLEEEQNYSKKNDSQTNNIPNTDDVDFKESEELNVPDTSYESGHSSTVLIMNKSDIVQNVQTEVDTSQKQLCKDIMLIVDNPPTNQDRDNETHQQYLDQNNENMVDDAQIIEKKHTEDETSQVDELQVPCYSQTTLQQEQLCMHSESDSHSDASENEEKCFRSCLGVSDGTCTKSGHDTDGLKELDTNAAEHTHETRKHAKHTNISVGLETEAVEAHDLCSTLEAEHANRSGIDTDSLKKYGLNAEEPGHHKTRPHTQQTMGSEMEDVEAHFLPTSETTHDTLNSANYDVYVNQEDTECEYNAITQIEQNTENEENVRSEACPDADPQSNNSPEEQNSKDNEDSLSNIDSDSEPDHSLVSDQADRQTDQDRSATCKLQESEVLSECQTLEEECVTKKSSDDDLYSDKQEDVDSLTDYPRQSHQGGEYCDELGSCKWQNKLQPVEQSVCGEQTDSAEEKYMDEHSTSDYPDKHFDAQLAYEYMTDSVRMESDEEKHNTQSEDTEAQEDGAMDHDNSVDPMEISQHMLDFVNLALKSSALTFRYDSKGHLRIEPDRCKIIEKSMVESYADNQYRQKSLPSPNTSDLSDYRLETSDSLADMSQVSTDLLTEREEEDEERLYMFQENMESSENFNSMDNSSVKPRTLTASKPTTGPSLESTDSLSSFPEYMADSIVQGPGLSNGNSESAQCRASHVKVDSSEGILIDKGRWLLKENHLIRKSPPVPVGMYENAETTSADTGQDNTSEDPPYSNHCCQHSHLAVISSSELEDMAKPPTPKCSYFNMSHASDSDPFLDDESINSNKRRGDRRKSKDLKVSPVGEASKKGVKQNGRLPSFASVEFKVATGKVHPEGGLPSTAVEKSARCQSVSSKAPHEEEAVETLSLKCGQHCPIL